MTAVYDLFGRAAGALGNADSGEPWTLRPWFPWDGGGSTIAQSTSVLDLDGAGFARSTDDVHAQMATIDHGTGDTTLSVDLNLTSLIDGTGVGVTFRWQDDTHFWTAQLYNGAGAGNASILIQKQDGSTFAGRTLWSHFLGTLTSSIGVLEVVLSDSSIEARYYDNSVTPAGTLTVTDSAFASATHHGINTYFSAASVIDAFNGVSVRGWRVGSVGFA